MHFLHPEPIAKAAHILLSGGVVIIPTDTVYGIAAHPHCPSALIRIRTIKGRDIEKPIALLAADTDAVTAFGAELTPVTRRLAETYWPGALTLVLPCGATYEGFRVPDHHLTRALLYACGGTLRVTSANLSGALPACSAVSALKDIGLEADFVIDDGVSPGGIASTVVKVTTDGVVTIIRESAITAEAIQRIAHPISRPTLL